jgi:serine phosphatase RsbU (regulator of sigma subunit)
MVGYTDGLVERRGEVLDRGLERLQRAAAAGAQPLEQMLDRVVDDLTYDGAKDDTVIVGMRWTGS